MPDHDRPAPARPPAPSAERAPENSGASGAAARPDDRSKRTVEIEIAGRRFRVRSDDDDRYVQTLVDFVNQRLDHMRRAANLVDREQTALLCLVDLADALFRERGARERLRDQVATESTQLRQLLVALSEPPPARETRETREAREPAARTSDAALAAVAAARPRARRP